MLEVGAAKADITVWEPGLGMMGWGMLENRCEHVTTPLHARAFVLHDPQSGARLAMICVELCFVSLALRERVCERLRTEHAELGLDLDNVMMMATHTHSGPGGFTHYPFYNVTIPGFAANVLEELASRIVTAISSAAESAVPARVRYDRAAFPAEHEVAFNRSVEAYNRNPDVQPVSEHEAHLALDRTMRLLRFDTLDGRPIGSINWFAVHCTSVHSDNTGIHFDNKGYAAQIAEAEQDADGRPLGVVAFAQGATGDVTPNFVRHSGRPFVRGKFPDDDESARFNGQLQADHALGILASAAEAPAQSARLQHAHAFFDLADVEVDPRFVDGRTDLRTSSAEIGMAMFFGTEEGPGLPRQLRFLQGWAARARRFVGRTAADAGRDRAQAEKIPWVESGRRRILGLRRLRRIPLPWRLHASLRLVRELDRGDDPEAKPWTPNVLPAQLFRIGDIVIAAVPGEFTTVSGRRLRESIRQTLGAKEVILAGYANAYAGYVTTPEEYALQDYEGASTHFGKWTLPAWQTVFDRVARSMQGTEPLPETRRPHVFTAEELAARAFAS
jgi:neutral ceramidase